MRLDAPAGERTARFAIVDAARGAALTAMFVYHFAWDLGFLGFTTLDVTADPYWRAFARAIAGSFLALVGVSLVLATRNGLRLRAFLRRLALIVAAAAAITIATVFATPQSYIFFGILHAIAVASVLGLAFLRAPLWFVLASAALVLAAPHFLGHPAFDLAPFRWVGLGTALPVTNDYVPVFPWFGMTLLGIAGARIVLARGAASAAPAQWHPRRRASRLLVWGGRHSLAIYLLHQPVFLGLLFLAAQIIEPRAELSPERFVQSCRTSCIEAGGAAEICAASCTCLADELHAEGLWGSVATNQLDELQRLRLSQLAGQCRQRASEDR